MQNSVQARAGAQVLIDDHARDAQLLSIYQPLKLQRFAVQVAIQKKQLWYELVISTDHFAIRVLVWNPRRRSGQSRNGRINIRYTSNSHFHMTHKSMAYKNGC
jgi:hypothetical protein